MTSWRRRHLAETFAALAMGLLASGAAGFPARVGAAPPTAAQTQGQLPRACTLALRAEVKAQLPWPAALDQFPSEEESLGGGGSSCDYPSVMVQVLTFLPQTIEAARKRGPLEPVAGVGDEAYLFANPSGYLELYARVGRRLLTLQADLKPGQNAAAVRQGAVGLAKLMVPKLR